MILIIFPVCNPAFYNNLKKSSEPFNLEDFPNFCGFLNDGRMHQLSHSQSSVNTIILLTAAWAPDRRQV
jgi:hypothetical protein